MASAFDDGSLSTYSEEAEDAVRALELAFDLGIRVPRVRRIVRHQNVVHCIMDRIQGAPIDTEWLGLGWIASIRLAFQLRGMIRRMRSVQSPTAGSLATGQCRSFYLEDSFGLPPNAILDQVDAFINFWSNFTSIGHEIKKTPAQHAVCPKPVIFSTPPMVFVHHDLAPRNIMLDPNGQLWLVDWDLAGFYPKFFEYAGMHNFLAAGWSKSAMWRWKLFTWIAAGRSDREARCLDITRSKFTRFRYARRFNMKANGYAAAAGRPDTE